MPDRVMEAQERGSVPEEAHGEAGLMEQEGEVEGRIDRG